MKTKLLLIAFLASLNVLAQDYFPGGVPGAETWFIANHDELNQQTYINHGIPRIKINPCGNTTNGLFNFNHSIETDKLCLFYNATLENTSSRNIFFVGEPSDAQINFTHVTTDWNQDLNGLPQLQSDISNKFSVAEKASHINEQSSTYQSISNAHINFYHWNIYQMDKRIKSYGYDGETSFYIGREYYSPEPKGQFFKGNFPEFISFPFELNANQKNRIESYLALKYGITLEKQNYRNSKNIVFWNETNYTLFGNRIFGIGRDDISRLNQLQSESVHNKEYLMTSVKELMATNPIKQQMVSIDNNNFIVFGDNGVADGLDNTNDFNVRPLQRKWLSQNTGEKALSIPIFFKFSLKEAIQQALMNDPTLKVWMLHDKYVNNQEESDFNSQYVEYYEPASMDGYDFAYFEEIYFDPDTGTFDQYTFGVGPEMIVQLRFHNDCDGDDIVKTDVVITGGRPPYNINIQSTGGVNQNFSTEENILTFDAVAPYTYTATVVDSQGNQGEAQVEVIVPHIEVNFPPDAILSPSQPQITLNAGEFVNDPTATYKWYQNDVLLEHYESTLVVTEAGSYKVIVTSGNQLCEATDSIKVFYDFTGSVQGSSTCDEPSGSITLNLEGGFPPYTTVISGNNETIVQVHNTDTFVFNDISFGYYNIVTTDGNGEFYHGSVDVHGIEIDLLSQLEYLCGTVYYYPFYDYPVAGCETAFTIDASVLVVNPNATYEWFLNGVSTGIYDPVINVVPNQVDPPPTGIVDYMVKITDPQTGCFVTEHFGMKGRWGMESGVQTASVEDDIKHKSEKPEASVLDTKVYPNPSNPASVFYYEVTSNEKIDGTVRVISPTGAIIHQVPISGESAYTLPFTLLSSGVYFITTETNSGVLVTDKIIIR